MMIVKKKYSKMTVGFVIQDYEENDDGFFECTAQQFEASDEVDRDDLEGNPIDINTAKEIYFPFEMRQP
ncbi:MAG: hypothetical protein M0R03_20720 [Novosphingobium sp.]|jgi:hypothetical protein|nr:hypothetical protein [Novosphingobium sp.]